VEVSQNHFDSHNFQKCVLVPWGLFHSVLQSDCDGLSVMFTVQNVFCGVIVCTFNYVCCCIYDPQVLVLVGDQLDYSDDVCGVVLSVRFNEDILSVWNRNASDHQVRDSML
jgi:hypothetical protein